MWISQKSLFSWFTTSTQNYVVSVFIFLGAILLFFRLFGNLRIITVVFLLFTLLLRIKIRSIFVALLLMTLFVLPFFNPNKYYTVEVLRGRDILNSVFGYKDDYLLGYGVNIANIFVGLTGVSCFLLQKKLSEKNRITHTLQKRIKYVVLLAILFLGTTVYSSLRYSPYPIASIVWTLQYSQIFIVALAVTQYFLAFGSMKNLFFVTLLLSLIFQSVIGFWQFFKQAAVGISVEYETAKTFIVWALDENKSFFRISGTFLYPNQLALIAFILIVILLPYGIVNQKKAFLLTSFFGFITIVLTQSRTIWIASFLFLYLLIKRFSSQIIQLWKLSRLQKRSVFLVSFVCLLLFVIVIGPRILLSLYSPLEGAGIPVRVQMIQEGVAALVLSPWFGYGVGTNEYVLHLLFPNGYMSVFPSAVHQAFLQLMLEVGLVGLTFFLIPFVYLFRVFVNYKASRSTYLGFSYILCCIGIFMYYMFQPHVGIMEFPYLGLILGLGLYETAYVKKS